MHASEMLHLSFIIFNVMCVFRYVERVSEMLRQKMKQADILVLKGATMAEKRQEALQEQSRLEPRVDLLAGCTRELQKLVQHYFFVFVSVCTVDNLLAMSNEEAAGSRKY